MTPKEAFEILRDTPIDIRSAREDDIHSLYATAQNMALDSLQKQMWIPVSERLPEEYGLYLTSSRAYYDKATVEILYFDPKEEFDVEFWVEKVDAWMPLPPVFVEGYKK